MNGSRTPLLSAVLALAVVLSGCGAPVADPSASWSWPEDPPEDRIGWEAGYWYNESVAVNQSDGLNETELDAFVARTMARVERIRGLEFRESVPVEVVSRERYREESDVFRAKQDAWRDQVYEATFLVGEDESSADALNALYGGAIAGYYTPGDDQIVVVSDAERPRIDRATLAHELVHALQDQHFGFTGSPPTHDGRVADDGLYEGDANYVESVYEERCAGEWECVSRPSSAGGDRSSIDFGVYLTVYAPYSEGPEFVGDLRDRGGWAAVNDAYGDVPTTSEQILHPRKYPEEGPADVSAPDRSTAAWSRFDRESPTDRLGEVFMYVMFWETRSINRESLRRQTGRYSRYNYTTSATAGWAGDELVPYRNGEGEYGYVWVTEWETEDDADQFYTRYRQFLLQLRMHAERLDSQTFVIRRGPFADAFRIRKNGTRVTVVNAPTVEGLEEIHPRG